MARVWHRGGSRILGAEPSRVFFPLEITIAWKVGAFEKNFGFKGRGPLDPPVGPWVGDTKALSFENLWQARRVHTRHDGFPNPGFLFWVEITLLWFPECRILGSCAFWRSCWVWCAQSPESPVKTSGSFLTLWFRPNFTLSVFNSWGLFAFQCQVACYFALYLSLGILMFPPGTRGWLCRWLSIQKGVSHCEHTQFFCEKNSFFTQESFSSFWRQEISLSWREKDSLFEALFQHLAIFVHKKRINVSWNSGRLCFQHQKWLACEKHHKNAPLKVFDFTRFLSPPGRLLLVSCGKLKVDFLRLLDTASRIALPSTKTSCFILIHWSELSPPYDCDYITVKLISYPWLAYSERFAESFVQKRSGRVGFFWGGGSLRVSCLYKFLSRGGNRISGRPWCV